MDVIALSKIWGEVQVEENLIDVIAVDPLADEYNKILKKRGINYPVKLTKGTGENLRLPKNYFDISYSRNALDHTVDPKKCINNMVKVLKKGGHLYLCGYVKEGTDCNWIGIHQHDLIIENKDLMHYNKEKKMTNLTNDLNLKVVYKSQSGNDVGDWFTIILQKN